MSLSRSSERRILLVFDSSSVGTSLIRAAVSLAIDLRAPIEALLIEDANLSRLAGAGSSSTSVCACQVSRHSAQGGTVTGEQLDRELRIHARKIEQRLGEIANLASVEYSFRVIRGVIDDEIRAAAATVDLLALWGPRRSPDPVADSVLSPPGSAATMRLISNQLSRRPPHRTATPPSEETPGLGVVASGILLLNCQSQTLRQSLLLDLIRHPQRRTILVPA